MAAKKKAVKKKVAKRKTAKKTAAKRVVTKKKTTVKKKATAKKRGAVKSAAQKKSVKKKAGVKKSVKKAVHSPKGKTKTGVKKKATPKAKAAQKSSAASRKSSADKKTTQLKHAAVKQISRTSDRARHAATRDTERAITPPRKISTAPVSTVGKKFPKLPKALFKPGSRVRTTKGNYVGTTGKVTRQDPCLGTYFMTFDRYERDSAYQGIEWGPYFASELEPVKK
ncbi:MAG: hypothetical protein OEZ68_14045 [Gammaproteobacteria bacterium]|nr:hypothetical protein [Gammaproteobacteria bacterium]MDH5801924.1 hypothetical protein [Gammaproteobacteria bacterium]